MNDENASNKFNIKLKNQLIDIFPINYLVILSREEENNADI